MLAATSLLSREPLMMPSLEYGSLVGLGGVEQAQPDLDLCPGALFKLMAVAVKENELLHCGIIYTYPVVLISFLFWSLLIIILYRPLITPV